MTTGTYPTLHMLRHRVAFCTMRQVVEKDGFVSLSRYPVAWIWAWIYAQKHLPSFISQYGYAIKEAFDRPTHVISIRAGAALDLTSAAWVYEERRKSMPRWYKVIGFTEDGPFVEVTCHLVEKSDAAVAPRDDLSPQQIGEMR